MKKLLLLIIMILVFSGIGYGDFEGIKMSTENVHFFLNPPLDSLYGIPRKPDSVHVLTYTVGGMRYGVANASYPFTAAGIDTIKHLGDTSYQFFDAIEDIDGAAGNFVLNISVALFYDEVPTYTYASVQVVSDSLENFLDASKDSSSSAAILSQNNLDTLQVQDDWVAQEGSLFDPTSDSVIVDVSSAGAADGLLAVGSDTTWNKVLTGATFNILNSAGKIVRQIKGGSVIHDGTSDNTPANGANSFSLETGGGSPTTSTIDNFYNHQRLVIVDGTGEGQLVIISDYTGSSQVATVTPAFLTTPDATSVYEILPGLVHAETQGGGYEDGAVWVSSSGSAGTQLYVDGTIDNPIDDGSFANAKTVADALGITTFRMETGSEITLATTYNNYDFKGTAWHLALGGQDLGHSNIHGAEVSGTATGSNVIQFFDCIMDSLTISPTNFYRCGFGETVDSVTASAPGTYIFRDCYSIISGIVTPKFSLGDAVADVNFGFRNYDGGIELSEIGSLGNDSVSIEGNGNLILNASNVGGQLVIRGNWTITDNSSTTTITRDAVFNRTEVSTPIIDTVNVMIKYFDTLIYRGCVWVDAGANTNTVIGVDGVPSNPVGTIAAAKTIADNLGIYNICLLDAASETIGETMEHYKFCGLTRSAVIDLGGQDVDGSFFTNLTVTGEQGGTGLIVVTNSGLSNADSLEIHARNCAIIGNLSLRAGDNFFDKCYSSVAGNNTPVLDFNDVNTTVNVSWRAYSGGLELKNMTTDHTVSYETLGQLVINANCDNGNVTVRGMCTITDNGTDMNITKDAVFSRQEAVYWVWSNIDTTIGPDTSLIGEWLSTGISASLSNANMGAIADSVWQALLAQYSAVPGSAGDVLLDSIDALVSSAGGVANISDADMKAIIDTLFNRLVSDTVSATYLSQLLRQSTGAGFGAYSIFVRILDTAGADSPVPGVMVYANNTAEDLTNPWEAITNSAGYAEFKLSDSAKLIFNGYGYAAVDSLIKAIALDTIVLSTYSSTAGKANVYGNIIRNSGQPYDSAIVEFALIASPEDSVIYIGDTLVMQTFSADTADINGRFDLAIYAIPNLTSGADTLFYKITVRDKRGRKINRYSGISFHVPDTSSVAWSTLPRWRD